MKKIIITCDVCKQDKDCETLSISFNGNSYGIKSKQFDVCRDCCISHKLFEEKFNNQYDYPKTDAETLFELIGNIARNAIQE